MRSADRRLERISIGPKRLIVFDWQVHLRLIDHFFINPLEVSILQLLLVACMWVVNDDQSIRCPNELGNLFENTLKVSTRSLMTEWWASKRVKRHCMNFTTAFALLAFALYNLSVSYAWNLYSSNSSSMYFLPKATRLASIFSRFTAHNSLFLSVTYKWKALP